MPTTMVIVIPKGFRFCYTCFRLFTEEEFQNSGLEDEHGVWCSQDCFNQDEFKEITVYPNGNRKLVYNARAIMVTVKLISASRG